MCAAASRPPRPGPRATASGATAARRPTPASPPPPTCKRPTRPRRAPRVRRLTGIRFSQLIDQYDRDYLSGARLSVLDPAADLSHAEDEGISVRSRRGGF